MLCLFAACRRRTKRPLFVSARFPMQWLQLILYCEDALMLLIHTTADHMPTIQIKDRH